MFGPEYAAGCPHCSAIADGFNGIAVHLANHDVMLWAVSRAPLAKLQPYKRRMGWTFPWASSGDSNFDFDFDVSYTPEQQRTGNTSTTIARADSTRARSTSPRTIRPPIPPPKPPAPRSPPRRHGLATFTRQAPGMSAFALDDGVLYHTYSAYARGLDGLWGVYQWLDRVPKGATNPASGMRRHDEYNKG